VQDAVTHAPLPLQMFSLTIPPKGTAADEKGEFVLKVLEPGNYELVVSFVVMNPTKSSVKLSETKRYPQQCCSLQPPQTERRIVEVKATRDKVWRNN
jgi:hypothetical protein